MSKNTATFVLALLCCCAISFMDSSKTCANHINVIVMIDNNKTKASFELLQNNVNNRTDILPNVCLRMYYSEHLQNDIGRALHFLVTALSTAPTKHVIIGPEYSSQATVVSELARYYNIPQVGFSTTAPDLSNKVKHPLFMRTCPIKTANNKAVVSLLEKFNWQRIATVTGDASYTFETYNKFRNLIETQTNISIAVSTTFKGTAQVQLDYLKKTDPRILVGFFPFSATDWHFACDIYQSGLYGPTIQWLINGFSPLFPKSPTELCTVAQMTEVCNGMISFDNKAIISFTDKVEGVIGGQTLFTQYVELWKSMSKSFYHMSATMADSFWTVVIGFQTAIKMHGTDWLTSWDYNNASIGQMIYWTMTNTTFWGYSGNVSFAKDGDRHDTTIILQGQNGKLVELGTFISSTEQLVMNRSVWFYNGKPPLDTRVTETHFIRINVAAQYIIVALAVNGVMFAIACVIFNQWNIHLRYIKMSSPRINNIIVVGCVVCFFTMIAVTFSPLSIDTAPSLNWVCNIRVWLLAIGFDLAYVSMFAKTWRVHYVFSNKRVIRKAIKDWHLLLIISIVTGIDVIILFVRTFIDPIRWKVVEVGVPTEEHGVEIIHKIITCASNNQLPFVLPIYILKGILLIFGIFFAWETRNVTMEALNDSKQIGVCVYSVMVMSVITVPLLYMLPPGQITLSTCFLNLAIFVCSSTTLLLVFVPKMYNIQRKGARVDEEPKHPLDTCHSRHHESNHEL